MRTKLVVGMGCALAVAVVAAPAEAAYWKGKTSQGRTVTVRTGADGLVTKVRIRWRANCRRSWIVGRTAFVRPLDRLEPRAFEDGGSYPAPVEGGIQATDTAFIQGRLTSRNRWRGTFHVRSVLRRDGRVVDRCRLRRVRWSARPAG